MAKKKSGETNLPLIIALVFFVLTTIAFGVLWYMQYSDHQAKEEAIKKAASERAAAQGLAAEAEMKAKVYRCYLGIADEKDRTDIGAETKGKDKISAELRRINEELAKAGGYLAGPPPPGLIIWNPDNPTEPPARGLIQSYADARQKLQAAEKTSRDAIQDFRGAVAALKAAADELQKYSLDFKKQADDFPKQLNAKIQEVIKRYDDRIRIYASEEEKARKEIDSQAEQIAKLDREKKLIEQKTQRLEQEVELLMDKMAQKRDVFEYDQPLGTILRRLPNNLVEINLGFRDLVRPGLTFVVLPDDFPQKGRQSRLRRIRVPDERGIYQDQVRFVPRGSIEVVEVLGPSLSRARITEEPEPIRDGIAPGDLLYNAVWRRGAADHIALVGIFDINADGRDDIETMVRELASMGIPVDAYYDLRKRQWVGELTAQTRYVVLGMLPVQNINDPLRDRKTELIGLINKAVEEAKRRGIQEVGYRDFFPRLGYRVQIDVPPAKINQAAMPFMGGVVTEDSEPPRTGN
ncbi:MAG: hypothetical protein WHU94_03275 [Thermogemmata sp.]|jgi:hypothetical protein|nr:hypothetical protein [Gemmataceae bacterium]